MICLVAVLSGEAEHSGIAGGERLRRAPALLVLARPGRSALSCNAGASIVTLQLARAPLQIRASALSGQPMRIAARDAVVAGVEDPVFAMLGALARTLEAQPGGGLEHRVGPIETAIVEALLGRVDWSGLAVVSRAVERALETISECAGETLDLDRLAATHGITLRTLRETFSACLGRPLAVFVQEARLYQARERLLSGVDSRPIQQIAEAAGFKHGSAFSRAYHRLFGEAPSQTRARRVKRGSLDWT